MCVEVGTGRILSMVQSKRYDDTGGKGTGGAGYTATAVNWNTDKAYGGSGGFQPGSTYKAFTLIDWLEKGHGLNEIVDGTRADVAGRLLRLRQPRRRLRRRATTPRARAATRRSCAAPRCR